MAAVPERPPVPTAPTSLQTWLTQGEQLYAAALTDFRSIEAQLDDLEQKLAAKQAEVNQIAQVIGKPGVEGARRPSAQPAYAPAGDDGHGHHERLPAVVTGTVVSPPPSNSSNATIARALTGKFGR